MRQQTKIELLAPARNLQTGIEAINCGADAVYIGAVAFGARHAAGNSVDDIAKLVAHAHQYGAKVYVTINTIIYDDELESVRQLAIALHNVGVDALITQDTALLEMGLPIPLHASTQMDNRTVEQAQRLQAWGFEQIVLARELGLKQIAQIHEACPNLKLEAFVHGALCVSYSGRCYASEHCFKRSANRGECAQFCRLAFNLEDGNKRVLVRNKHLLSLKDMNRSASLEAMLDAGISSFKIEGRLKDEGYVKNTTAYYSALLNDIIQKRKGDFCRASSGHSHPAFEPNLSKSFNRGFTEYFLQTQNEDVASIHTPKSIGQPVGHVKEIRHGYIVVGGVNSFNNGDGLCYFTNQGTLEGFRINKVENNKLYPYRIPQSLQAKDLLYRNYDAQFETDLQRPTPKRTLSVTIHIEDTAEGFKLTASDELYHSVQLTIETGKELARSPQQERIKKELQKLGDTIYEADDVQLHLSDNYFIPASILSQWRRALIEKLQATYESNSRPDNGTTPKPYSLNATQLDYWANVANRLAEDFYHKQGAKSIQPAFELQQPEGPAVIMTCRHCIRYTLGQCLKHKSGQPSPSPLRDRLPNELYLSLPDGRRFPLKFNCSKCEMIVLSQKDAEQ